MRYRPYPRLISMRDKGSRGRGNNKHGEGGGRWCDSRGRGGGSNRGKGGDSSRGGGPHTRSVGGVVPTEGLFRSRTGRELEIFFREEDLNK